MRIFKKQKKELSFDNILRFMISEVYNKKAVEKIEMPEYVFKLYQPQFKDNLIDKKSVLYLYGIPVKFTNKNKIEIK